MAIPTFVAAGTFVSGTGAVSPGLPAGWAQDDIFILYIHTVDGTVTVPSGYAHVTNSPIVGATSGTRLTVLWKRATASESAPSIADTGSGTLARMVAFRGCTTSGNPWDVTAIAQSETSNTAVSFPSVTTTQADALVILVAGHQNDVSHSGWTNAALSSVTEHADNLSSSVPIGSIAIASGGKAAAGSTGTSSATTSSSPFDTYDYTFTISLKAASASGGGAMACTLPEPAFLGAGTTPLDYGVESILFESGVTQDPVTSLTYPSVRIPAIIRAANGDLLAFAEGRTVPSDAGEIHLLQRRSQDDGGTWGPVEIIAEDRGNGTTCVGNPVPLVNSQGHIFMFHNRQPTTAHDDRHVWVIKSTDHGATWDAGTNLDSTLKDAAWGWHGCGPCHGIVKAFAPNKGRMIVPFYAATLDANPSPMDFAGAIYSDDDGATWQMGYRSETSIGEPTIAELANGDLLMVARADASVVGATCKQFTVSTDGGTTWGATFQPGGSWTSPQVQNSVIRHTGAKHLSQPLITSGPSSTEPARNTMVLRKSTDDGVTWSTQQTVYTDDAAYSDMVITGVNSVGLLWENGITSPYKYIKFRRVPLTGIEQVGAATTQETPGTDATTLVCNKPTGTATNDVLIGIFTSNSKVVTPPSGFTEFGTATTSDNGLMTKWFYKVAGGSEPTTYTWTTSTAGPLCVSMTAWRGAWTGTGGPIAGFASANDIVNGVEPTVTPTFEAQTGNGLLMFSRSVFVNATTPDPNFTITDASYREVSDFNVHTAANTSRATGFYAGNNGFESNRYANKPGLAITQDLAETRWITASWALRAAAGPGYAEPTMPKLSANVTAIVEANVDVELPKLVVDMAGVYVTDIDGTLDTVLPKPVVNLPAGIESSGAVEINLPSISTSWDVWQLIATLDTVIPMPVVEQVGETRRFGLDVIVVEEEKRAFRITQDDMIPIFARESRAPKKVQASAGLAFTTVKAENIQKGPLGPQDLNLTSQAFDAGVATTFQVGVALVSATTIVQSNFLQVGLPLPLVDSSGSHEVGGPMDGVISQIGVSIEAEAFTGGVVDTVMPSATVSMTGESFNDSSGVMGSTMPSMTVSNEVDNKATYVVEYATPQDAANAATGGRWLIFPTSPQTYTVTSLQIPASCYVIGNDNTLKFPDDSTVDSSHSDEILKIIGSSVTIDNLNFDGRVDNQSGIWSQHRHAVRAHGNYSNGTVKNCNFTNLIGDGVYVNVSASGQSGNTWLVDGCIFTGLNKNRNGVSIISGTDVVVQDCDFSKMSRSDMPGAIDIEPNSATDTLQSIYIHDNVIDGGSTAPGDVTESGIIFYNVPNSSADDIQIYDNEIYGTRINSAITVVGIDGGPFNNATNVDVHGNNIHDINSGGIGVELDWWIGADVYNNTFNAMSYGIYNYKACLGTSTGNSFTGVTVANITNDTPHCS